MKMENMSTTKKIFFGLIGLSMATAAGLQFYLVYELDDKCTSPLPDITSAPTIAGVTLAGSFVTNFLWLYTRQKGMDTAKRASLLLWVFLVLFGMAAAGATLGQIQLYNLACPLLASKSDVNFNSVQYVSIALLILSIAAPHALKKVPAAPSLLSQPPTGLPITKTDERTILDTSQLSTKPLIFV